MIEKIFQIISNIPLFQGLSVEELREICHIAVDKFYGKGRTIFLEGDDGNGFYVVAGGKVKVFKVSMDGKEQILHIYGLQVMAMQHFSLQLTQTLMQAIEGL